MPILTAIQYKPNFARCHEDVYKNILNCKNLVLQAASFGSEIIVFPELSFTGYSFLSYDEAFNVSEPVHGKTYEMMAELAQLLKCYVVWGFVELDNQNNLYNSASIINHNGEVLLTSRKMNLWGNDFLWATQSNDILRIVETDIGWVSIVICRDIINKIPGSYKKIFNDSKLDIVAAPVNWNCSSFPPTDWVEFSQENNCDIIISNRWGEESNGSFKNNFGQGGSAIISKDSKINIKGLVFNENCVITKMV